jgi:integrase
MELEPLQKLNNQLKDDGYKFSVCVHKNSFHARGTFLLNDGSKKRKRIKLGVPADITRLSEARKRLTELQLVIDQNQNVLPETLPWEKKFKTQSSQIEVKEAKKLYIKHWWKNKKSDFEWWVIQNDDGTRNREAEKARNKVATTQELTDKRSWSGISPYLNRLDDIANSPLSVGSLKYIAESNYPPGTRGRKQIVQVFKKVIELSQSYDVGGFKEDLDQLQANKYKAKKKPRIDDHKLLEIIDKLSIKMPEWGWCFKMMYTFGLRPSECFGAKVNPNLTATVLGLKGDNGLEERTAFTLTKSMIEVWNLWEIDRPYEYNMTDKKYDPIKAKQWTDQWGKKLRRVLKQEEMDKFTLYMIRHSWAIRAIKSKVNSAACAISMGHSLDVFESTYLSSIREQDISEIQESL